MSSTQFHISCLPEMLMWPFLRSHNFSGLLIPLLWNEDLDWITSKSIPTLTVHNSDFLFTPPLVIPSLYLCSQPVVLGSRDVSPVPQGTWVDSWPSTVQLKCPHGPIWAVSLPPTSDKHVLDVKLRDDGDSSQTVKLKLKIYLAHCGFISCPETELDAADGA